MSGSGYRHTATILLLILAILAAISWLASCGGDEGAITVITDDPDGASAATTTVTETTPTTTTATVEPTGEIEIPFTAGPFSGGTEEVMVLNDIRFAQHEGYERFVIEFVGQQANPVDSLPRYTISRGTPPYLDAEGNEVPIAGEAWIEIRVNGSTADLSVDPYVEVYTGPEYFEPAYDQVYTMELVPAYENNTLILLLDVWNAPSFRVIELVSPPRIVLDIESV